MDISLDSLHARALRRGLHTERLGCTIIYRRRLASTNDLARDLAAGGCPDGALILADHQTRGRGSHGRSWQAPPGSSLLFSLILRPPLPATRISRLVMLGAVAVQAALRSVAAVSAAVTTKWPNDVLVDGKKVCGILVEGALSGDQIEWAVLGVGLNVNIAEQDMAAISAEATSLSLQAGAPLPRRPLLQQILAEMDARYTALAADGGAAVWREWQSGLWPIGQTLPAAVDGAERQALVAGVDEDGALLLHLPDGQRRRMPAWGVVE